MVSIKSNRLTAWFERLSDRERNLVLGGGSVLLLVALVLGVVLVQRRVTALEEEVTTGEAALAELTKQAPDYLRRKAERVATDAQLEKAAKESLQATVLNIAKEVSFDADDGEGGKSSQKLSDVIKFQNATELLAELTTKKKAGQQQKKKTKKKGQKEVFLASIDAQFQNVPDEALLRFIARLETHPEPLFGLTLDINRTGTTREAMQATLKIGQFRYGTLEE